jgi:hypothetical protein
LRTIGNSPKPDGATNVDRPNDPYDQVVLTLRPCRDIATGGNAGRVPLVVEKRTAWLRESILRDGLDGPVNWRGEQLAAEVVEQTGRRGL